MSSPQKTAFNLYADASVANNEVLKPLTAVPNSSAPQEGVHLYHFCASLCSQKVRLVLEEKGVPYTSHHVLIAKVYEQYDPTYVRINRRCVVPALVTDGKVTTDSSNIMKYVDQELGDENSPCLMPKDPKEQELVTKFLDLGDAVAVEALTYGTVPGGPPQSWFLQKMTAGAHQSKAKTLRELIVRYKDDEYLRTAYETKLKLVETNIGIVGSEQSMTEVLHTTHDIIAQLNKQLVEGPASNGTSWLCGDDYALADAIWGVILNRLQYRGLDDIFWGKYPAVEAYSQRLIQRPAFQKAVTEFSSSRVIFGYIMAAKLKQQKTLTALVAITGAIAAAAVWRLGRGSRS